MSQYHKTSILLTAEEKQFLDENCISLTKFVRTKIHEILNYPQNENRLQPTKLNLTHFPDQGGNL